MSSLNGARAAWRAPFFPVFSSSQPSTLPNRTRATLSALFSFTYPPASSRVSSPVSSVFEEIMRQRIRAVSRNSARQRPRGAPGRVVREDISGYGDFYVPILIHAGTTRRMARYFLRATAFRASAEIYESCRPALSLSPSLTLRSRGMIYFERTRIIGSAEHRRDFLTNIIVHSTMYFARHSAEH